MSISDSGIDCNPKFGPISVTIMKTHPLIQLALPLPWRVLFDLIMPDLKKTAAGKWWVGRKLQVRIHLGVYLLQQLLNLTDRKMEYGVKDNAAYQVFCGFGIIDKWHAPDHTKTEDFRSRLSPETQRKLANILAAHSVKLGFGDPSEVE